MASDAIPSLVFAVAAWPVFPCDLLQYRIPFAWLRKGCACGGGAGARAQRAAGGGGGVLGPGGRWGRGDRRRCPGPAARRSAASLPTDGAVRSSTVRTAPPLKPLNHADTMLCSVCVRSPGYPSSSTNLRASKSRSIAHAPAASASPTVTAVIARHVVAVHVTIPT